MYVQSCDKCTSHGCSSYVRRILFGLSMDVPMFRNGCPMDIHWTSLCYLGFINKIIKLYDKNSQLYRHNFLCGLIYISMYILYVYRVVYFNFNRLECLKTLTFKTKMFQTKIAKFQEEHKKMYQTNFSCTDQIKFSSIKIFCRFKE